MVNSEEKFQYGIIRYFKQLDNKISNSEEISKTESEKYFKIILKMFQTSFLSSLSKKEIIKFKNIVKIQEFQEMNNDERFNLELLFYYFYDFNISFHNLKGKIKLSYLKKEINIISEYYSVFYELKEYRSTEKLINMHNNAILELIKKNKFSFFKNRKLKKYIIQI